MAYITPNSTVRFHKNVPLDNTYDHTLWFANISSQNTYFSDSLHRIQLSLSNYSYQRHSKDSIKVATAIENIANCNYLSFQNTAFENKWFYAFITNLEYVNNVTTIVYYEIDVIQTYLFDVSFDQCFIERQHTETDNVGDNTIPENIDFGEYQFEDGYMSKGSSIAQDIFDEYSVIVATTLDANYDSTTSSWVYTQKTGLCYGGVYSGVYFKEFPIITKNPITGYYSYDTSAVDQYIQALASRGTIEGSGADCIVSIFMMPTRLVADMLISNDVPHIVINYQKYSYNGAKWTYNGSVAKNNKLYTYPFSKLVVNNGEGVTADYRYEFFSGNTCNFDIQCATACTPEMQLVPQSYKGVANNYNEKIAVQNFPQCSYNIDSYKAWLAQNGTRTMINTAFDFANIATGVGALVGGEQTGATSGSGVGNIVSGFKGVANTLIDIVLASNLGPQAKGVSTNIINVAKHELGFHFYFARPRDEYAKIVDDYFTRYGYAIHQNKVPNFHARSRFTYIKTIDCTISGTINGNIPNVYSKQMVDILNNGITFWADHVNVGNYDLANNVLVNNLNNEPEVSPENNEPEVSPENNEENENEIIE